MPSGSSAYWASDLHGIDPHSIPTRRASLISATTDQMGVIIRRRIGTSFTFLGFTYIWGKSRQSKNVARQVTGKEPLRPSAGGSYSPGVGATGISPSLTSTPI